MTLDVRSAQVLIECARRGSLGRAAVALNMTQPAVTRMLQRVEQGFGIALFTRTTRGVVPTAYGEAILPYAELVVSEISNAEDMIRQMRGASLGVVRVGGVGSVVGNLLVNAITAMRDSHPSVQFHIVEELEDKLLDDLKAGTIDIAVSPEPYVDDEITLATPETLHDRVSTFARCGHPALAQDQVTLAEAARLDWAMPPLGTPVVREWLRRFHGAGLEPTPPCLMSRSVPTLKAAILASDMVCWMPEPLVAEEIKQGTICAIPCSALDWQRSFRVWRRKRGLMTPPTQILLRHIRELAGADTGG